MKILAGNTYPHRATIKANGGRWQADCQCWLVPDHCYDELRKLIDGETDEVSIRDVPVQPGSQLNIALKYELPDSFSNTRLVISRIACLVTGVVKRKWPHSGYHAHTILVDRIELAPSRLVEPLDNVGESEDEEF
jgi:hypothetical protein